MVGILVDDDLIASPVPVGDDVVIERGDVPEPVVEPKALPVSASEREYVLGPKAARETSVRPGVIEVIMGIGGAAVVAHPTVILGVDVGDIRMAFPIHGNVVFIRGVGLLTTRRRRLLRLGSSGGSGTARGNMAAANLGLVTAAVRLSTPSSVLCENRHAQQHR